MTLTPLDMQKIEAWDRLVESLRGPGGERLLFDGLTYPGNGRPARKVDANPEVPGWPRLAKDSPLGQKAIIVYDERTDDLPAPMPILELNGTDLDATQVQLTLGSPMVIPRPFADLAEINAQTMTGEFDNAAMASWGAFPGTIESIAWPPLLYVIEWGIGGARTHMEVDAVNGARVNLTCSFLRVWGVVAPDAVNQPGTSGAYVLSAFVGPGWPTPSAKTQRTIYVGDLATATASGILPTPLHAKAITVIGAGAPASGDVPPVTVAYLRFYQDPAGARCVGNYIINGNQPIAFPIPNGGQYFSIVNGMGTTVSFAALFELAA